MGMIRTALSEFFAFATRPRLVAPGGLRLADDWRRWAVMAGLYLAGLFVLGALSGAWSRAFHLPAPEVFSRFPPALLFPAVVLVAPVCEEALFRGWLTGRPRALWLLVMAMIVAGLLAAIQIQVQETAASIAVLLVMVVAVAGWFVLRRWPVPRWYAGAFPALFVLSVGVFALLHLSNYPHLSWALVPMVLPQAWAGLVFGYTRMRFGLPASMLLHGLGNAATLAAALLLHA